ncbi:DUF1499 domain-containing protein [Marinomonas algarum]|uniref:DUF1499 domain-containing protein n=1 Tax=Marinomonas algarum TaxID=2883105 RepID=A0A9X1INF9_9GAMM|nr:DUF1499 domain-containing protein [Marinomonas algarum]MCB5161251.1 DUF1499 domain-containing protein [Marinomonas algarum]
MKSRLGSGAVALAIFAVFTIGVMMFGARLGLWQPIVGFGLVRNYMNPIAYAVLGLGILGVIYYQVVKNHRGLGKSLFTAVVGIALLAPTLYGTINPPVRVPPIHDITTNTTNPPLFQVLDESREGAKNTLVYGGPEVAAFQQQAYPDIAPIFSDTSPQAAFKEALRVAKEMGWDIVAEDQTALRFEASAKTSVYQFVDDVVVAVSSVEGKSRVDIRSVSRIGRSDRGVNAERIRTFIRLFEK